MYFRKYAILTIQNIRIQINYNMKSILKLARGKKHNCSPLVKSTKGPGREY